MNKKSLKGFSYEVPLERVDDYSRWPVEKRLEWLYEANRLRNLIPAEIIRIQEEFRKGERD